MLRSLLLAGALALLLPHGAAAQVHSLTASATVLEPVRPGPALEVVLRGGDGVLEVDAPRGGRHIVTVWAAPMEASTAAQGGGRMLVRDAAGGTRMAPVGGESVRVGPESGGTRIDLREVAAPGVRHLRVTYVIAVDA